MTTVDSPGRAVLVSYTYRPSRRVIAYAEFLVEQGVSIDFVTWEGRYWREMDLPAEVRLHSVRVDEHRYFVRRFEHLLVYRIPGGVLAAMRRVTRGRKAIRPLDRVVAFAQRVHSKLAGAFHGRIFVPFYRVVRPHVLAAVTTRKLRDVDLGQVDRIVATDAYAITYGWRLAKRFPLAVATTGLDRGPYLEPDAD